MSRSSYGKPPKGPNKGSAGKPNVKDARVSPTAPTVHTRGTTPDMHQHKPIVSEPTKAGGNKPGAPNKPSGGF